MIDVNERRNSIDEIGKRAFFFHGRQKVHINMNNSTFIILITALFNFLVSWYCGGLTPGLRIGSRPATSELL